MEAFLSNPTYALQVPGARPNVFLLLQDQLRADVTTADGISTPGLDRLRAEGMTFDRAYTPTGSAARPRLRQDPGDQGTHVRPAAAVSPFLISLPRHG